MSRRNLTLIHDSLPNPKVVQSRDQWGLENAKQLKLFGDIDRNYLILIAMRQMDTFSFANLIEAKNPVSIIDTRKYPDFFGFYRSTKAALDRFRKAKINYVHAPISWATLTETEESWTIRSSLIDGLSRAKGTSEFHGQSFFLLISTDEMRTACSSAVMALPEFDQHWNLQAL